MTDSLPAIARARHARRPALSPTLRFVMTRFGRFAMLVFMVCDPYIRATPSRRSSVFSASTARNTPSASAAMRS